MIEYINGQEEHSSSWAKFYVKGLEKVAEKGEYSNYSKHNHYQSWVVAHAPEELIFTIFVQNGDKMGTRNYEFHICKVAVPDVCEIRDEANNYCTGNFKILCSGIGKVKAPRLLSWWKKAPADRLEEYAIACGELINKRGHKEAPILDKKPEQPSGIDEGDRALLRATIARYGADELTEYISRPE